MCQSFGSTLFIILYLCMFCMFHPYKPKKSLYTNKVIAYIWAKHFLKRFICFLNLLFVFLASCITDWDLSGGPFWRVMLTHKKALQLQSAANERWIHGVRTLSQESCTQHQKRPRRDANMSVFFSRELVFFFKGNSKVVVYIAKKCKPIVCFYKIWMDVERIYRQ